MAISKGDRIPHAQLTVMTEQGPSPVDAAELMAEGTTVLFAVPGAFTPTCSAQHLPGFVEHAAEIEQKGVDRIICMAVNDVFVMDAWGKSAEVGDKIIMAADGNADFHAGARAGNGRTRLWNGPASTAFRHDRAQW